MYGVFGTVVSDPIVVYLEWFICVGEGAKLRPHKNHSNLNNRILCTATTVLNLRILPCRCLLSDLLSLESKHPTMMYSWFKLVWEGGRSEAPLPPSQPIYTRILCSRREGVEAKRLRRASLPQPTSLSQGYLHVQVMLGR